MTVLVLLSRTAGAGIIRINLPSLSGLRRSHSRLVPVCCKRLRHLLSLYFLFQFNLVKYAHRLFLDAPHHFLEHLIARNLVFYERILLSIRLQADSITEDIHIINMAHPLLIHHLQEDDTLRFTHLFRIRELRFLLFIKTDSLLLQILREFIPRHVRIFLFRELQLSKRNNLHQSII